MVWHWILSLFLQANGLSETMTGGSIKDNLQDMICAGYMREAEDRDLDRILTMRYELEREEALKAMREDALRKCGVKP
jgi:hypothetical protein